MFDARELLFIVRFTMNVKIIALSLKFYKYFKSKTNSTLKTERGQHCHYAISTYEHGKRMSYHMHVH